MSNTMYLHSITTVIISLGLPSFVDHLLGLSPIQSTPEEHDIVWSKPTVGSVCGRLCRALPFIHIGVKPRDGIE